MKVEQRALPDQQPENDVRAHVLSHGGGFGEYNVVASYGSQREAQQAVQAVKSEGLPGSQVAFFGAPGPVTKQRMRGSDRKLTGEVAAWAIAGMVLLGALGAAGGLLLTPIDTFPWWMGVLWGAVVFGTLGGVVGGQLGIIFSRGSDESRSEPGVLVGVRSEDAAPVDRAAEVLARMGPRRLWRLDRNGDAV